MTTCTDYLHWTEAGAATCVCGRLAALQPRSEGTTPAPATPNIWHPIETHSGSSTPVLVSFVNDRGRRITTKAAFFAAGTLDLDDSLDGSDMLDEDGKNAEAGWFEDSDVRDPGFYWLTQQPTHWMPLPEPPSAACSPGAVPEARPQETTTDSAAKGQE